MSTSKIEEGVMGGVMAMPAINRIMQLAGLEHSGATNPEVEKLSETSLLEAEADDILNKLAASAASMPDYKDSPEAQRLYAAGALISSIAKSMGDMPPQTVQGQTQLQALKALSPMGASLIKTASDIAAKAPSQATTPTTPTAAGTAI